ncbi:hypothetical protein EV424DRAFT_292793 [Suillus variegatus]|nr:hypothetical protein EV424DRAFT_292793 [Suillus variegatus]
MNKAPSAESARSKSHTAITAVLLRILLNMSVPDTFSLQLAKYTNGKVRLMTTFIVIHDSTLVAALAVLAYDYFVTLHSEVQWSSGRKWGIVRTTFMVSRYVPFAGAIMTSYTAIKTWGTQNCMPFNNATNGMHFLGIIASEGLLIARIYGFSGNNNTCLIILLCFASIILVMAVIISAAPIDWNMAGSPPCAFEGSRHSALPYGLLAFLEIVLMSTTAYLRYRHYLGSHSTLMRSIYRDGLLYMFCIIMISSANIVIHSVLASRILFNLPVNKAPVFPTYQSTPSTEMLSCPHEFDAMSEGGQTVCDVDHNQV